MTYKKIIEEIVKAKGDRSYRDIAKSSDVSLAQTYKTLNTQHVSSGETIIKLANSVGFEVVLKKIKK